MKLLGAPELIDQFRRLSDEKAVDYVSQSIQAGAEVVFDAIERAAPDKTGRLRGAFSIQVVQQAKLRVVWGIFVGPEAFYWKYLQYGTKYITPRRFISKALSNRRSTARQTIRDTFRDLMAGFK